MPVQPPIRRSGAAICGSDWCETGTSSCIPARHDVSHAGCPGHHTPEVSTCGTPEMDAALEEEETLE
ncbi:hypothetical protein MCOR25_003727 [Pyricularia grisea]|nr:hypothetical protein MCOR25_003727 [Pyricularia grisea]